MTNDQKDAICQLWIEIFGTQEGVGYNCPQGAYQFAEVAMAYERKACAKVCEERADSYKYATDPWAHEHISEANTCAAAIRARGEK